MYNSFNKLRLLLICIVIIAILISCKREDNKDEIILMKTPITLSTVSMFGGSDTNTEKYQLINNVFMQQNENVIIEDDSQDSDQDWKAKIAADFAVGNEPDVIQFFIDANASDVLAANKFVTIDEIRKEYPDYADDTLPTALKAATNPDGISRAVPTTGYWEGLFCNKDLFDKYNLELPTDWDKMTKAINVFKENGVIPISVSLNNIPHYWLENLILSASGQEIYEQVPEEAPEEWIMGLDMFRTLREMGAFPDDTDIIDNNTAGNLFRNKKAAMHLDGSWFSSGVFDQTNTVVIPFPVIPGGKAEYGDIVGGISSGFYITKKAWRDPIKKDIAVKFVMAHTNKEAVAKYWNGSGQAATKVDVPLNMTELGKFGIELSENARSISSPIDSRLDQVAYNVLIAGIVDVSTGVISPKDLINQALKVINN